MAFHQKAVRFMSDKFTKEMIAERIKQIRLAKGISQYELSYNLGHSRNYINNIERQESFPSLAEYFEIINYLGVTAEQFHATNKSLSYLKLIKALEMVTEDEDLDFITQFIERVTKNK